MMKRGHGFTLVELVIVIAIMGLLLAIGIPSFRTWLNTTQIRNAAEATLNGMQLARVEAMRRNDRVSFWLVSLADASIMDNSCARSSTGTSWVVSRSDPAGQCLATMADPTKPLYQSTPPAIVQRKAAGEGNRDAVVSATDSAGAASSCVTFDGLGGVQATCSDAAASNPISRVTVSIQSGDADARRLEIRISGGAIRMCDPAVSSSSGDPRAC